MSKKTAIPFAKYCQQVKEKSPLIQVLNNYVTIHDVANVILASGGRPVMTDNLPNSKDVVKTADLLLLNAASPRPNQELLDLAAIAKNDHHPVVLDPVGVSAMPFKLKLCQELIDRGLVRAVKGNASEIRSLLFEKSQGSGVDLGPGDEVSLANLADFAPDFKAYAQEKGIILAMSGPIDLVTDGERLAVIENGHSWMASYTGSGCQLSGVLASFLAGNPDEDPFYLATAAMISYGVAGEIAAQVLQPYEGNATYSNRVIDQVFLLEAKELERRAKYDIQ
ncbi:hydroxyethylthiazole kinase [Aerococcus sp. Group 1]|uniref:hydroxyethylthiazole kinase n=2 Tax=Aerococcus urinae (strain CCUG 59500 / ACS-120-V-Col10a) TaxID=2976812 RepID=UPI00227BF2A3|nr:hydroxyethylthiazole kinase [Aerococcus sp. Group 1]MCY3031608.1 hydroxyethylthiazole kinase [Aerococcus sp. Group 1]MCY3054974.1 hydroxyethylthiazole kinase [Aerococcus sp. Group 1]MCY3056704.1 hydroxyethylthiazole kinase [Aerococcus sp. Group 1]MCY3061475.1 hydroxyethylthiazole kinase [Aerococcus sp. Group 1]